MKKDLLNHCKSLVEEKITIAQSEMNRAQEAANNETKSSAGDKYETGRAMNQRERDLHARQLEQLLNMKMTLGLIKENQVLDKVSLGAIVHTELAVFFVAVGLGLIEVKSKKYMVISAISPIAQAMIDKSKGEEFFWAGKSNKVLELG